MKNFYTLIGATALFIFVSGGLSAQTVNQGAWMIGGGVGYVSQSNSEIDLDISTFYFTPRVAYYVIDNLGVGLGVDFVSFTIDGESESSTSLTPYARYYVFDAIFAQASYELPFEEDVDGTFAVGAGYSWFLNNSVAIEPTVVYRSSGDNSSFGLEIGIQAFIGRN